MGRNKEMLKDAFRQLKSKEWYKQIPNLLTASRLFSPLVIIPAALVGNIPLALGASAVFASTDLFDGIIARKLNAHSELGRKLDAATDKVFAGSLLIALSFSNPLILLNLGLEAVISGVNLMSERKGNQPKTVYFGKVKTALLSFTILTSFAEPIFEIPRYISTILISTTAAAQIGVSGIYYKKFVSAELKKKFKQALHENDSINEIVEDLDKTKSLEDLKDKIASFNDLSLEDLRNIAEKEIQHEKRK